MPCYFGEVAYPWEKEEEGSENEGRGPDGACRDLGVVLLWRSGLAMGEGRREEQKQRERELREVVWRGLRRVEEETVGVLCGKTGVTETLKLGFITWTSNKS